MKSLQKLHFYAYLILLVLTLLMATGTIIAVLTGDIGALSGGLAAFVFVVFAIVQVVCLAMYQPGLSVYKIGFYLMHVGLLVLLAGLAAYALVGESINVQVPISETGNYYRYVTNEKGENIDLGFAFKLDKFTLEKYESGSDKYYRTDMTFTDPTTLATEGDYLEVNRTLRKNGWKIYLMSYSDGVSTLRAMDDGRGNSIYNMVHTTYSAQGKTAGADIVDKVYADIKGKWYDYYLYNEDTNRLEPVSEEKISAIGGNLWAYTFRQDDYVLVYLTQSASAEKISGTGNDVLARVEEGYPDAEIRYYEFITDPYRTDYRSAKLLYTVDAPKVTTEDAPVTAPVTGETPATTPSTGDAESNPLAEITDQVHAYVCVDASGKVKVYILEEEITPDASYSTTEGGSAMLATLSEKYGKAASAPTFQIYDAKSGWYVTVAEEQVYAEEGVLNAYAVNMGDSLVIFVHPLSNLLLLKRDPGEYATVIGMVLVMLGGVMMCLIRGRKNKKVKDDGDDDQIPASQVPVTQVPAEEIPASQSTGNQAPPSRPSQSKKRKKAKGGRKR
ncbi:MAG: cytochrome c biogenesis protein ResB [Clostridia bacterium]|nr:cytochrome c biogenesis protein ResB [Clostridia bacterium]